MKSKILMLLLLSVCTLFHLQAVTLTDTQNRSLEAKILLRSGSSIKIELANGRQFTIPIDTLNKESQEAVLDWQAEKVAKIAEPFRLSISSFVEDKEKLNTTVDNSQIYKSGYSITVSNRTPMVLDDLRVEYIVVKEAAKIAAQSENDKKIQTLKGEVKLVPIQQGQDGKFQTETISMKSFKLKSQYTMGKGRDSNAVDELVGIWLKFYIGSKLVYEHARPINLVESIKWDDPPNPQ